MKVGSRGFYFIEIDVPIMFYRNVARTHQEYEPSTANSDRQTRLDSNSPPHKARDLRNIR